jgi:hypothetical protein
MADGLPLPPGPVQVEAHRKVLTVIAGEPIWAAGRDSAASGR